MNAALVRVNVRDLAVVEAVRVRDLVGKLVDRGDMGFRDSVQQCIPMRVIAVAAAALRQGVLLRVGCSKA